MNASPTKQEYYHSINSKLRLEFGPQSTCLHCRHDYPVYCDCDDCNCADYLRRFAHLVGEDSDDECPDCDGYHPQPHLADVPPADEPDPGSLPIANWVPFEVPNSPSIPKEGM